MEASSDSRRLPRLVVDLFRGFVDLARTTGALFSHEAQQTAHVAGRRFVAVVLAMTLLLAGVLLLVAAAGFLVGVLLGETWAGFAVVGGLALMCGAGAMAWAVHSLSTRRDLRFPETREQIRRDAQWLDQQLGNATRQNSHD